MEGKKLVIIGVILLIVILLLALVSHFYPRDHPTGAFLGTDAVDAANKKNTQPPEENVIDPKGENVKASQGEISS